MGMKINIPIGTRVKIRYHDLEDNCEGIIIGKITNIFNGLIFPNSDSDESVVAGVYAEKWIENGKELEIKRHFNDKTNIYKQDIISVIG